MAKRSTTVRPAKQRVRLAGAEGGTRGDQEGQEAVRHPPTAPRPANCAPTRQLRVGAGVMRDHVLAR